MTPTEQAVKEFTAFKGGKNVAKTQRQQAVDKNFQIQVGVQNPSKVTLNPNGKHGVMVTTMAAPTASSQSRNIITNSNYYVPMP